MTGVYGEVSNFGKYDDNFTWQRCIAPFSLLSGSDLLQEMNLLECSGKQNPTIFYSENISLDVDVIIG